MDAEAPVETGLPHQPRAPLHLRILGGFLGLQVLVLAASMALIGSAQSRRIENDARQRLQVTRSVFSSLIEVRERQSILALTLLSKDFALRQAIATHDPATIASVASNARNRIDATRAWIFDENAKGYASSGSLVLPKKNELVATALKSGSPASVVRALSGVPCLLIAVPISAPDPIGVILAAFAIDDAWAAGLKKTTLSDVSFTVEGAIAASTLDAATRAGAQRELAALKPEEAAVAGDKGNEHIMYASSIGDGVGVAIQRSWTAEIEPVQSLRRTLLLVGLVGFVATAILGYFIAESMTDSINRLIARLTTTNEKLERLTGFQTKFFSMVAHDIKNPLGTIMGCSQMLADTRREHDVPKLSDLIFKATKALNFLVSDLVDFAAIENGILRVDVAGELNLPAAAALIRDRMEVLAQKKNVTFVVKEVPSLPSLRGDQQRIVQVLQNLSGNALQYTPAGGTVTLEVTKRDGEVRLAVTDTGIGISMDDLPKIFHRFFQAGKARELHKGGFGLGLKIASEIAQAHKGAIGVYSELGKGSTFFLTLPLPDGAA